MSFCVDKSNSNFLMTLIFKVKVYDSHMQMLCRCFVAENSITEILKNNIIKLEDYTIICVASSCTGITFVFGQKLLSVRKVDIRACKCMLRQ